MAAKAAAETISIKAPPEIHKKLYDYQKEGVKWLSELHHKGPGGGILADDMGLGKTRQICSFLAGLFDLKLAGRVLIIVPPSLLFGWTEELTEVKLSHELREYSSKKHEDALQDVINKDKGILLTTYEIATANVESLRCSWSYMIVDEGQLLKNAKSTRHEKLNSITTDHRIILSGTPVENDLMELWALFWFCKPKLLGDAASFKKHYERHIVRGRKANASKEKQKISVDTAETLRKRIAPYFLRRLKSEVICQDSTNNAKLPKKIEIVVWLRLTSFQRKHYMNSLKDYLEDLKNLEKNTIKGKHAFKAVEDLREICDYSQSKENKPNDDKLKEMFRRSVKIRFIVQFLEKLSKEHSVIIFSRRRRMLDLIEKGLQLGDLYCEKLDGRVDRDKKQTLINDFKIGKVPILLVSPKVGSLGLTLTKADRVIIVAPDWNPSVDAQGVDRAYRLGQENDVITYRLVTCGTVDEKAYLKQLFKGGLLKIATESKDQQAPYCSEADLKGVLSLPKSEDVFDKSCTRIRLNEEHDYQLKIEQTLEKHVKFLETLDIEGISMHSLLFSRPAAKLNVQVTEKVKTGRLMAGEGSSRARSSDERFVHSKYAMTPKDLMESQKNLKNKGKS